MNFKNFFLIIITFFFSILFTYSADIENNISPKGNSIITVNDTGTQVIDNIFNKVIDYTFGLLALIVVGVFIYIGYLFITSSGNEEKFKKAWKMFMYAVIGIALISLSWGIVKLVTTIGL